MVIYHEYTLKKYNVSPVNVGFFFSLLVYYFKKKISNSWPTWTLWGVKDDPFACVIKKFWIKCIIWIQFYTGDQRLKAWQMNHLIDLYDIISTLAISERNNIVASMYVCRLIYKLFGLDMIAYKLFELFSAWSWACFLF